MILCRRFTKHCEKLLCGCAIEHCTGYLKNKAFCGCFNIMGFDIRAKHNKKDCERCKKFLEDEPEKARYCE